MNTRLLLPTTVLASFAAGLSAHAAVNFNGTAYTQNFDTLGTGSVNWTNNSTLPGWYAHQSATNNAPATLNAPLATGTGTGSGSKGNWFNFGNGTDRALGGSPATATGAITYGVALTNTTGATITSFELSFDWERWFNADISVNQTPTFAYSTDATALTAGTYVDVPSASVTYTRPDPVLPEVWFSSPDVASRSITVTGINWAPGSQLWLRWQDVNEGGGDHGVGIDNVVFTTTAIPEPSSYAILLAGVTAGAVTLRRRRKG